MLTLPKPVHSLLECAAHAVLAVALINDTSK